ncbi:MAG: hypothetical protein LBT64_00370, partial [Puniceicoccales bacterium]|nr:hypothetical protein [Puniceicoccales bacterium]
GANQSAKESNIQLESLSEPLAQVKKEKSTSELLSSESFATSSAIALNNAENVAPKESTADGDQEQLDADSRKIINFSAAIDLTDHSEFSELEPLHTPKITITRANTETASSQNENETMAAVESSEQPLSAKKKKGHGRSKTFGAAIEKPSNGAVFVHKLRRSLSTPSSARNINGASGRELNVDSKTFNNDVKEILHEVHYEKEKSRSTSAFFKNLCDSLSEKNIDNLATEENLDLLWKIVALDGKECPFRKSIMALIPRNLDNLIHYFKEQVALSQGYYASDGIAEM